MPGSGTSTFIDPDDYQSIPHVVRLDLLVTAWSAFKARLTWATLHHLHLLRSEEELPRIGFVSLAPALSVVGFATRSDPPMSWGGVELQPDEIVFHSRGERFHQRTTGASSWGLIGLAPEYLERHGRALLGKPFSLPAAGRRLRPAVRDGARLRRLHAQACRLAESRPKILAHPEVARAIEQGLVQALVTCLTAAKIQQERVAKRHHARIMVRLEEMLAEHPSRPLQLAELCERLGVTDRTLRSCSAEFLGMSPSRYVLLRRLKQARSALRDADPVTGSVAEIARRCGFTELRRFAAAYRNAFGEIPSTTLQRARAAEFSGSIFSDPA